MGHTPNPNALFGLLHPILFVEICLRVSCGCSRHALDLVWSHIPVVFDFNIPSHIYICFDDNFTGLETQVLHFKGE